MSRPYRRSELADALDRMRQTIQEKGWRQRSMFGEDGSCCVIGAARLSTGNRERARQVETFLDQFVYNFGSGYTSVILWNDLPERTERQVLDMLKRASRFLRAGTCTLEGKRP